MRTSKTGAQRATNLLIFVIQVGAITTVVGTGCIYAQGRSQSGSHAPESSQAATVRSLNNSVLELHGRAQGTASINAQTEQAATVIAERASALAALIQKNPREGLSFAFSPELLADLAAKFPGSASFLESHGTWQGVVEHWIVDDATLKHSYSITRMKIGKRTVELHFAYEQPALQSGTLLQVSGIIVGGQLDVASSTVQAAPTMTSSSTSSTTASCSTTGPQKTAVLLLTFPGVTPPAGVTPQSVSDVFFGTTGRSLDGFWRESSYGLTSATGDVLGWYTLPTSYTCSTGGQMLNDALAAASAAGVNFQNYSRLFLVHPDLGCGWAGYSTGGCTTLTLPNGTTTASLSYLLWSFFANHDDGVHLVTHEGGHSLGLFHARTRGFGSEALGPLGTAGDIAEYGNEFSTMGSWNLGQYVAPHKAEVLNWLASGTNYQVVQTTGTYVLQPLETIPAGLQALKVQRGTGNNTWVWIEYRQPIGNYDSTLAAQSAPGATIYYEDAITGSFSDQLDMTPGDSSWANPTLAAGKTWVDPYSNLSISIQSASSNGLNVNVSYGAAPAPTCVRSNPRVTVSPLNPSIYPGQSASYSVSITNSDSAACSSNNFVFGSSAPSAWSTAFSSSSLTLSPGQSGSFILSKGAPAGTPPGTYTVDISAADGSLIGTDTANATVVTLPSLSVNISVSGSSFTTRQTASFRATTVNGGSPAPGASVKFTLTKADGSMLTKTITADFNGAAGWSYRIGQKDPRGSWSITAQAIYNSTSAAGNAAIFTVQ